VERLSRILKNLFFLSVYVYAAIIVVNSIHVVWGEPEQQTFDVTTTSVIVNWYDTERELQIALRDPELVGLSECEMRPRFNTSFCELWLVRPENTDDDFAFDTIGHEFYHAIKGPWHE